KKNGHAEILNYIHKHKTAALIRTSLQAGAILAKGTPQQVAQLGTYGEKIGLAFQIADDVLDIVGDKKKLGKKGSDEANKKLTYPAIYGLEVSRKKAGVLIEEAKAALKSFGTRAQVLKQLAN